MYLDEAHSIGAVCGLGFMVVWYRILARVRGSSSTEEEQGVSVPGRGALRWCGLWYSSLVWIHSLVHGADVLTLAPSFPHPRFSWYPVQLTNSCAAGSLILLTPTQRMDPGTTSSHFQARWVARAGAWSSTGTWMCEMWTLWWARSRRASDRPEDTLPAARWANWSLISSALDIEKFGLENIVPFMIQSQRTYYFNLCGSFSSFTHPTPFERLVSHLRRASPTNFYCTPMSPPVAEQVN